MPEFTADTTGMGTLRLLEAIRTRGLADPLLPGRQRARCSAGRGDARRARRTPFYPRSPYARRQGLRPLDDRQLPRGVRPVRLRTASCSTTSRRGAARRSSPARSRAGWPPSRPGREREALPGQPRRPARLGLRAGVRRGDVADAPAAGARRLRDRDRRDAHGPRVRARSPSRSSGSTGASYVRDRSRATSGRPRSTSCAATPAKAGARARLAAAHDASPSSCASWSRPICCEAGLDPAAHDGPLRPAVRVAA